MNRKELLKNFSIGFIPLFIFIVMDELYGTQAGLVAAIVVGLIEFVYFYFKYRRIESFLLFDIGLIVALGAVSIILENDLFFKLKPALVELILAMLLGVHAFSDKPILLMMGKRYLKDIPVNDLQLQLMRKMH